MRRNAHTHITSYCIITTNEYLICRGKCMNLLSDGSNIQLPRSQLWKAEVVLVSCEKLLLGMHNRKSAYIHIIHPFSAQWKINFKQRHHSTWAYGTRGHNMDAATPLSLQISVTIRWFCGWVKQYKIINPSNDQWVKLKSKFPQAWNFLAKSQQLTIISLFKRVANKKKNSL